MVYEGTAFEGGRVGIVAAVAMGDAFGGKTSHDVSCLLWHTETAKEERHMDVWFVALVVELFVEEALQLFAEFFLADQFNHSGQVHRRAPTVLPACTLIEPVAFHLGEGLVDVLELFWPNAVEDFLASATPADCLFLHAQLFCKLS